MFQSRNQEGVLNARISNHLMRMNPASLALVLDCSNRDSPPDYDTAVKANETESEELPTYLEAVSNEELAVGNTRISHIC